MVWDDVTTTKLLEVGTLIAAVAAVFLYGKYAEYQTKKKGKK